MFSGGPDKGAKILEDLSQLAGGVVSMASGLGRQIKEEIRARVDEVILKMDFVPRSEFERLEALVQKLRVEQEKMAEQLGDDKPAKTKKK
ncbi:MAG: accessory factor UbiK family protein [Alphaproteobacteria bacterium]|nr:accessory factor UbiK family protein [Alphaproteobacteria bacterium]MCD8519737.1 accessory factor UbiK family protein [Alphaproteobacteria bacterium]MCD8571297.1 accessory factor UbiK family protein [Alphaproteobacteria bacterium]